MNGAVGSHPPHAALLPGFCCRFADLGPGSLFCSLFLWDSGEETRNYQLMSHNKYMGLHSLRWPPNYANGIMCCGSLRRRGERAMVALPSVCVCGWGVELGLGGPLE